LLKIDFNGIFLRPSKLTTPCRKILLETLMINKFLPSYWIPRFFTVFTSQPMAPIMNQLNPIHTQFFYVLFSYYSPSTPLSPELSPSFTFSEASIMTPFLLILSYVGFMATYDRVFIKGRYIYVHKLYQYILICIIKITVKNPGE
jgi:hypothetical protein